jgi:hypothetical protein
MDEFGETPMFYTWPTYHEEGTAFPEDFYPRVAAALRAAGFDTESV